MNSIPVMLNVKNQTCLIVGGGRVGMRKAGALSEAGAEVIILDPAKLTSKFPHIQEAYNVQQLDLVNPFLIVAATDNAALNQQIVSDCQLRRRLVMQVDNPPNGHLVSMIYRTRGSILIAVHSGVPVFSRYLANQIVDKLPVKMIEIGLWLQEIRLFLKSYIPSISERENFWQEVFTLLEAAAITSEQVSKPEGGWGYFCDTLPALVQNSIEARYGRMELPPLPNLSETEA